MSTLLYRNPRLLTLVLFIIIVAGLSAFVNIPRQEDPVITNRQAIILTAFPGATAERVEALVTDKIEQELRSIAEIDTLESTSSNGLSIINVELLESLYDVEPVWSRIRDRLGEAETNLPSSALKPVFDEDRGYAFTLISSLIWRGDNTLPLSILGRFAEELQNRLRNIGGTDLVRVYGEPEEEIQVRIEPNILDSFGLSIGQVATALQQADAKVAAGQLRHPNGEYLFEVSGELNSLSRILSVPLVQDGGDVLVRVADVATINRGEITPAQEKALHNQTPAVVVAARIEGERRVDTWAAKVRAELDAFRATLPQGLELDIIFDQSRYTENRLASLGGNILLGAGIVVVILFLTLGWRAALLVTTALPLTSLMTLAVLFHLGIPINQISVTGLIVALGLLVDSAIVTVNTIQSHLLRGETILGALQKSIRHLWIPLLSSTLTTVLAFMPIILLPGPAGEFVGAIGISVSVALISSYLLSMTVIPALSGYFLGRAYQDVSAPPTWWRNGIRIDWLRNAFKRSLVVALKFPRLTIIASMILPLWGFIGMTTLTEQFFPPSDRDQFYIEFWLPESNAISVTQSTAQAMHQLLAAENEVREVHWFIGNSAPAFYYNLISDQDGAANYAQALVQTDSIEATQRLLQRLQPKLDNAFPQAQILVRELLQGPPFKAPLEIRLVGADLQILREYGEKIRLAMSQVPFVTHVRSSLNGGEPKLLFQVDEDAARLAQLRPVAIAQQLDHRLEGARGGSILEATEELPVRVRLADSERADLNAVLASHLIPTNTTNRTFANDYPAIPLLALGELQLQPAQASITRRNTERVNTISGYLIPGVLPDTAMQVLRQKLAEREWQLPSGYRLEIGGEAAERDEAVGKLMGSVGLIVVLMIATVVLSLNSFRLAAVIFLVAIQAMGLGLLSLVAFQYPFGFVVITGLMGLIGLAINAAIIILSTLQEYPRAAAGELDAIQDTIVEQCSRHIFSTTLTTFGGFIPLMLTSGGFWPPFAVSIAGGTVLCTLVSFYFVPAMYVWLRGARQQEKVAVGEVAHA